MVHTLCLNLRLTTLRSRPQLLGRPHYRVAMVKKQTVQLRMLLQKPIIIRAWHHRHVGSRGDPLACGLWTNTGAPRKTNRSHPLETTPETLRRPYVCLVVAQ